MDWQAILDVANGEGVNARRVDFMSNALIQLIPDRPSEKADAEWLEKRGWVKWDMWWFKGWLGFDENHADGHTEMVIRGDGGSARLLNPTRMTVALFEAGAMEAMKHGE